MTRQETLTKVIQKALDKRWKPYTGIAPSCLSPEVRKTRVVMHYSDGDGLEIPLSEYSVYGIIFDHKFAEALWGNEPCCSGCGIRKGYVTTPECIKSGRVSHDKDSIYWEYRLKDMVMSPDPVEYLEHHS